MGRVSLTIPDDILANLLYVSKRMGISRSSLVSSVLEGSVAHMKDMLELIPEDATSLSGSEVKRMRGLSVDIIKDQIQALEDLNDDDLFSDM